MIKFWIEMIKEAFSKNADGKRNLFYMFRATMFIIAVSFMLITSGAVFISGIMLSEPLLIIIGVILPILYYVLMLINYRIMYN